MDLMECRKLGDIGFAQKLQYWARRRFDFASSRVMYLSLSLRVSQA